MTEVAWISSGFPEELRDPCLDLLGFGPGAGETQDMIVGLCRGPGYADLGCGRAWSGRRVGACCRHNPAGLGVVCLSGVVSVPPDGEMIMETDAGPGCVQPDVALLAEFRSWLCRERGLSPVSVQCYSKQSKAFLAGIGGAGAVSGLDAGKVTAFMVDWTAGRNTWSAKAMVTSLRAFLRFAHATGRTGVPLAGAVPAVASWRGSSLPRGLKAAEIERLQAGCERDTAAGLRDYAVLSLLARLGLRGAEAAGLELGDIDWRAGEIAVTGKGSKTERLPLPILAGEALAARALGNALRERGLGNVVLPGHLLSGRQAVFCGVGRLAVGSEAAVAAFPSRQVTARALQFLSSFAMHRCHLMLISAMSVLCLGSTGGI